MCLLGGMGHHTPIVSEIARKLFKTQLCWKRNGHGLFCDFFLLVTVYHYY